MRRVDIIDVTLRDAHQSLWSTRMTTAMMLPAAPALDRAGFAAIDLVGGAVFDVCVRYLREDPWERMRIMSRAITRTPLIVMTRAQSLFTFEFFPDDVVELTAKRIAANGIRYVTPYDALNDMRNMMVPVRASRAAGLYVAGGVVYTLSPVHTDEYYARKARALVALGVDAVFLKDPSGLLTPERVRTLVPVLKTALGAVPLQLHSHCLTGLGPLCALEGIELGVDVVHTALSPLAHGASHPPTEWVARTARRMGFDVPVDVDALAPVAEYFRYVARREGKPLGEVAEYDPFHYEHQVPGGMISNLKSQLADLGIAHRLDEILDEAARVRRDLGYPIIVSPFAQFVVTQAVLNVVQGERYATVPDEVRKYALGYYGELAAPIDAAVADRITRGEQPITARPGELLAPGLDRVRAERGPFASDDDLLLATFYNDEQYTRLIQARPIDTAYPVALTPLATLVRELTARRDVASVKIHARRPEILRAVEAECEELGSGTPHVKVTATLEVAPATVKAATATVEVAPATVNIAPATATTPMNVPDGLVAVRSPMTGTFYRAPAPGAAPFVQPGDRVGKDDTVCIVEVMKLMSSIPAGIGGRVERICAENATVVAQDQILVLIAPELATR